MNIQMAMKTIRDYDSGKKVFEFIEDKEKYMEAKYFLKRFRERREEAKQATNA